MSIFIELSLILAVAVLVSLLMRLLRQPLIVGYIISGILVGPAALDLLQSREYVELFSNIGIAILLFIVGLTLNPIIVREVGKTSLITGIGQVVFTTIIGFFIVRFFGIGSLAAWYVALALSFSSTIIILKLLSDKNDLGSLYGKISIGFLLVQDVIAVIVLVAISAFRVSESSTASLAILFLVIKGIIAVTLLFVVARFLLPRLSQFIASSQELLFLFSVTWGLGLASLFTRLGFSLEVGALLGGITLAASPFAREIASRMKPLRDFFIVLFFILLGSGLAIADVKTLIVPAVILSLFVLIGNPVIVIILLNTLGYGRRVSFLAGLTVAQISEFSFILIALGVSVGHVPHSVVSLVTLVGMITIAGSTYLILYSRFLYSRLERFLVLLEWRSPKAKREKPMLTYEAVLFGYDRVGFDFVQSLKKICRRFAVVDFNPASIARLEKEGIVSHYGDAEDAEFLAEISLEKSKLLVSTLPDFETNIFLIEWYRKRNALGIAISISHTKEDAIKLYEAGASFVVMPHHLGAHYASLMISRYGFESTEFAREKELHLKRMSR